MGGNDKWLKYFKGKTFETVIRSKNKKTNLPVTFTHRDGKTSKINVMEPITVLPTSTYTSQMPIKYKEIEGTVSLDNIEKPGIAASKQKGVFKPQTFGVDGKKMKIGPYAKKVLDHIDKSEHIGGCLAIYLRALVNHYMVQPNPGELTKIWKKVDDPPIGDINNDFGEIMGPIALIKTDLPKARQKRLTFDDNTIINIPPAPNEPLMDFALYKSGKPPYIFSSKSLAIKQTNTVKCQDIIKLLCDPDKETGRESKICNTHKNTIQYKILEILCAHQMSQGGYAVGRYLLQDVNIKDFEGLDVENDVIKQLIGKKQPKGFMEEHFKVYMDNNNIPPNERTPIGVLYNIEKKIAKVTKNTDKLKFNKLFADAVRSQVIYIKFKINKSNGLPEWKLETSPDFEISTGIYLRSKTTKSRLVDKIGIQT